MQNKVENISRHKFIVNFVQLFRDELGKSVNEEYKSYLLPPGSATQEEYIRKCNKCYECISVCPYEVLRVAYEMNETIDSYPVIIPSITACNMCSDFPCINACEQGALISSLRDQPLGKIEIVENNCYAYSDHYCTSCVTNCPIGESAIYLDSNNKPHINIENCNGCGVCINTCPSEQPSIRIIN